MHGGNCLMTNWLRSLLRKTEPPPVVPAAEKWRPPPRWESEGIVPFIVYPGADAEHMDHVLVSEIRWDERRQDVCTYCGGAVRDGKCGGCQSTLYDAEHFIGRGYASLAAWLPQGGYVFSMPAGTRIDLIHRECRWLEYYDEVEVVIKLKNCKVVGWCLPSIMVDQPEWRQWLKLHVEVECDVEFYPGAKTS